MSGVHHGDSVIAAETAGTASPSTLPDREASLELLYRTYWHDLRRYIAKRFGAGPPEPEEVAQAAFAKLAAIDDVTTIDDPRGYLYTIACNLVIDDQRRLGRRAAAHREIEHMADALPGSSPERVLLAKERLAIFKETLRTMPHMRRRIFLLVRAEGHSPREVARRFGMSEDAVYKHVQRAIQDCAHAFARAEQQS